MRALQLLVGLEGRTQAFSGRFHTSIRSLTPHSDKGSVKREVYLLLICNVSPLLNYSALLKH